MDEEILKKLTHAGLLSEQALDLGFVSTGSLALNKVISGSYTRGVPIGYITQFHGESSTAKTVFVTQVLANAQKQGYYTILIDSENAYNSEFASTLGIDPSKLIYSAPETIEDCFSMMHKLIVEIREFDKDTPIIIGYDSIAVSPTKDELGEKEDYETNNMIGAMRAKVTGSCLRKINLIIKRNKAALLVVNQLRSKVGIMYGNPDTLAAGGRSLMYYLGVDIKTSSGKNDRIVDDSGNILGISGKIKNIKNKITKPFQECDFQLFFDRGLDPYYGLLPLLVKDGLVTKAGSWYTYENQKFQRKEFEESFKINDKFSALREKINF